MELTYEQAYSKLEEILNKLEKEIVFGNIINDKEILIENAKKLLEEKV